VVETGGKCVLADFGEEHAVPKIRRHAKIAAWLAGAMMKKMTEPCFSDPRVPEAPPMDGIMNQQIPSIADNEPASHAGSHVTTGDRPEREEGYQGKARKLTQSGVPTYALGRE
jgi:hypothetical protein